MKTKQIDFWSGDFGKEYTDRNPQNLEEWDKLFITSYGLKKTDINEFLIGDLSREIRILEVGCNIGLQLLGLQKMGFKHLYGIELQWYAAEKAKENTKGINILQGSGFDLPFKDNYFDLVFTNGVLIHIAPENLGGIMAEMVRVSKKYLMGFEYYEEKTLAIQYRGHEGYMWKGNYPEEFLNMDKNLRIVKSRVYPYITDKEKGNKDIAYLIEKV